MTQKHVIPPMTHPLGSAWDQPSRADILVDDTHALMVPGDVEKLSDYSCSIPSGVYEGKMWKRARDRREPEGGWFLCWYEPDGDPDMMAIRYRLIIEVL